MNNPTGPEMAAEVEENLPHGATASDVRAWAQTVVNTTVYAGCHDEEATVDAVVRRVGVDD